MVQVLISFLLITFFSFQTRGETTLTLSPWFPKPTGWIKGDPLVGSKMVGRPGVFDNSMQYSAGIQTSKKGLLSDYYLDLFYLHVQEDIGTMAQDIRVDQVDFVFYAGDSKFFEYGVGVKFLDLGSKETHQTTQTSTELNYRNFIPIVHLAAERQIYQKINGALQLRGIYLKEGASYLDVFGKLLFQLGTSNSFNVGYRSINLARNGSEYKYDLKFEGVVFELSFGI